MTGVNNNKQVNQVDLNQFKIGTRINQQDSDVKKSIFNQIDKDGDGVIEKNEYQGFVDYKFKGKDGKMHGGQLLKLKSLEHGRSLCVDQAGKQWIVSHDGYLLNEKYVENPEKFMAEAKYQQQVQARKAADKHSKNFYAIADENSGNWGDSVVKMKNYWDKNINSKNVLQMLDSYQNYLEKEGKSDSSIIDTVTSETGASATEQRVMLTTIIQTLCKAAKDAGVSEDDVAKARADFINSMNTELNAHTRRTNPKDMEKAVDFLRGAIIAKQNAGGEITDKQAIETVAKDFSEQNTKVQKEYKDARKEDGWAASVGDTVCGWFGCTTVEDMDKKLGANAKAAKLLATAKSEEEFKVRYKQVFGIEFDKNKIAARDVALGKYQQANAMDATIKVTDGILANSDSKDYAKLRAVIKEKFQINDEIADTIIANYGAVTGKEVKTEADKREMLLHFLKETKSASQSEYQTLTNGKTLEQMGKDLELLHKSAFGTSDIAKDVAQFNENMVVTEMVAESVFEVAGTIALQFVPSLGQMAAAKLAVSAAKWGTKAVKVANAAAKAEKAFAAVSKFQQGAGMTSKIASKAAKVSSSMATTGIATATVGLTNGDDAKAVMKKTLMNMSFAGVGVGANELAPKLMSAFGINKAIANELAEEIINAAGSYGITKIAGDDYGSSDAFIDLATGMALARLGHIKGGAPDISAPKPASTKPQIDVEAKPQIDVKPQVEADVQTKPAEVSTTKPETEAPTTKPESEVTTESAVKPNVSEETTMDKFLAKDVSEMSDAEMQALDDEINDIMDKAYDGQLENPAETLDKLEQVLVKMEDNINLPMVNILRKKLGLETKTVEIPTKASVDAPKAEVKEGFNVESVMKSKDSPEIRQLKTELYEQIKNHDLSDDEIKAILTKVNADNADLAKKICNDPEISSEKAELILDWAEDYNLGFVEKLYFDKSISYDVAEGILMRTQDYRVPLAEQMLADPNIPNDELWHHLGCLRDKESAKLASSIYMDNRFSTEEKLTLITGVNKYNLSYAEDIIYNRNLSPQDVRNLLGGVSSYNASFAKQIIDNPDFTPEQVSSLLQSVNVDNAKYAQDIILNRGYSAEQATRFLSSVNVENGALAAKIANNPDFKIEDATRLLRSYDFRTRKAIEDLYANYKNLGILPNQIRDVAVGAITVDRLQKLNSILDIDTVSKLQTNDYRLFDAFEPFMGKNNICELTKTEKRALLLALLKSKNAIQDNNLTNIIKLLPSDDLGYEKLVKGVTQSLSLDFNPLSAARAQAFDANLNDMATSLKTMDLSGLRKIELTMPHEEFVSRVQNMMKDLSPIEQAKVQDYFGFRIEDGKLGGYPNTRAKDLASLDITDAKTIQVIENMKSTVDEYTNSNFVTTNDIPELNKMLKTLSADMPEIFNQIDNSANSVKMIKSMQKIVQNPAFDSLSPSDQKTLMLATLLHNTDKMSGSASEAAFDAYFIAKKFNISDAEAQKVYKIVEASDAIDAYMSTKKGLTSNLFGRTERREFIDGMAFRLKEGNTFDLAQMLYSTKEKDGLTRYLDKAIKSRVDDMKATDFVLPQTTAETYMAHAKKQTVVRDGVEYNINVVNSEDIENFYAFIHTPEAGYTTGGSRAANFANFEIFKDFADDKVICTSYVTNGKAALVKEFHHGFIFDVANDHQYVGYGNDIFSLSKNTTNMLNEYYIDQGLQAAQHKGEKRRHRTMISDNLKSNLTGTDYKALATDFTTKKQAIIDKYEVEIRSLESKRKLLIQEKMGKGSITQAQYQQLKELPEMKQLEDDILKLRRTQNAEIEALPEFKQMKEIDKAYVERMDNIKKQLGTKTMTVENLEQIDPEFAKAYKALLEAGYNEDGNFLMNGFSHNEVLVSNPKITALYTDDINTIPEEYLRKAMEENIPIVIIKCK